MSRKCRAVGAACVLASGHARGPRSQNPGPRCPSFSPVPYRYPRPLDARTEPRIVHVHFVKPVTNGPSDGPG